jgi:hypothetical protein
VQPIHQRLEPLIILTGRHRPDHIPLGKSGSLETMSPTGWLNERVKRRK